MPPRGVAGAITCSRQLETQCEWKVENFFSLSEKSADWYDSPDFQFSGRTFCFQLYPNTWGGSIMPVLHFKAPGSAITIQFTLGIKTAAGATELWQSGTLELSMSRVYFFYKCMKRSELLDRRQELAPGDALTFTSSLKIDVSRSDIGTTDVAVQTCLDDIIDQDGNGGHRTLEKTDFAAFCQHIEEVKGKDCDVTLEVRGTKFRVHKLILESRTPVLAAMFSDSTAEAETAVVCVEDCHPEPFEVFLRFVYSGVAENLTIDNAVDVYYVANKYDLPRLKKECVRHMLSNLTTGSVCRVIDMAHRHGEELLKERATEFLVENAREIFKTPVWRKFTEENSLAYDLYTRVHKNWKYY